MGPGQSVEGRLAGVNRRNRNQPRKAQSESSDAAKKIGGAPGAFGMSKNEAGKSLFAGPCGLEKDAGRRLDPHAAAVDRRGSEDERRFAVKRDADEAVTAGEFSGGSERESLRARQAADIAIETSCHSCKLQIEGLRFGHEELGQALTRGEGAGEGGHDQRTGGDIHEAVAARRHEADARLAMGGKPRVQGQTTTALAMGGKERANVRRKAVVHQCADN